jgi:peroxiredoxin
MKKQVTLIFGFFLVLVISLNLHAQNVGDNAPNFTLDKLGGGTFTLSEQTGKVVFIFFFGNSCSHCLSNGPNTQSIIYNTYKNNPDFVAVGIDTWDGNASAVQSYKTTTGIEYTLLLNGSDVESNYLTTYDRIVVVDKQGKIQYKATQNATTTVTNAASDVIENLLGQSTSIINRSQTAGTLKLDSYLAQYQLSFDNPFKLGTKAQIVIYDLSGKIVLNSKLLLNEKTFLDISMLSTGYYTLSLIADNSLQVARFVKTE